MKKNICYHCFRDKGEYEVCAYCGHVEDDQPLEAYHLYPGTILCDRYLIGKSIGFGGFGITYRAYDLTLGIIVAVKEFYPAGLVNRAPGEKKVGVFSGDKEAEYDRQLQRFLEEARNMAVFSDEEDIVNVYDYFEENGTAYIIMEFIEGELLKTHLRQKGAMNPEEATAVAIAILEALRKMHKKNIIHKDISPDNIFLLGDGKVKIFDFGAAKFAQSESDKTLSAVVKAGYAPPEQYRSKGRTKPSMDLYAVGAVLYEMLTGTRPMEGPDRAIEDELQPPSQIVPEVGTELDSIVMKAMAVHEAIRFQSADEFIAAIKSNKECLSPDEELQKRIRNRKIIMGITGGATVILLAVIILLSTVFSSRNTLAGKTIEDDSITVWLQTENENLAEELKTTVTREYPQIQLDIVCYSRKEYQEQLKQAEATGKMPDLFWSDEMSDEEKQQYGTSLELLVNSLNEADYRYTEDYEKLYPEYREMPMGYQVEVAYINEDKMGTDTPDTVESGIKESEKILLVEGKDTDCTSLGQDDEATEMIIGDLRILNEVKDATINQLPPVNLAIAPVLTDGKLEATFTDCYMVNKNATPNQQYAAMQVLTYMLSDGIQSLTYMEGYEAIPVNEKAYQEYKDAKMTSYLSFIGDYEEKIIY